MLAFSVLSSMSKMTWSCDSDVVKAGIAFQEAHAHQVAVRVQFLSQSQVKCAQVVRMCARSVLSQGIVCAFSRAANHNVCALERRTFFIFIDIW